MKNLFVLLACTLMLATTTVSMAETPNPDATSLRESANEAGNAANGEANAPTSGEVAEAVTETVVGSDAAPGDGTPSLDADSGAEDAVGEID